MQASLYESPQRVLDTPVVVAGEKARDACYRLLGGKASLQPPVAVHSLLRNRQRRSIHYVTACTAAAFVGGAAYLLWRASRRCTEHRVPPTDRRPAELLIFACSPKEAPLPRPALKRPRWQWRPAGAMR